MKELWRFISMKSLDCAAKEFFVIKESCLVQNATKTIKQIFDAKYKNGNKPELFKGQI